MRHVDENICAHTTFSVQLESSVDDEVMLNVLRCQLTY